MARHFLIDTDTTSDDAVALVMAMQYPDVQIEAITVVAGNVSVDRGVQNALYTVELCQQAIPVHRGMPAPLTRSLETAQFVHGQDGAGVTRYKQKAQRVGKKRITSMGHYK